ncbi:hypothetical protein GDO81_007467 [Engystomops pustulosus]|uniref:Secreted protein n=1 Tax=Engystomops pustulosus TaxID=76066 RepID=A0AAV7C8Z0_ENGPU|nr:hypothetical protein GDO81_007467 [Engystomops pustulosus]
MSTRCRCCAEVRRSALNFTVLRWVQVSACQATLFFLMRRFFRIRQVFFMAYFPRVHTGADAPQSDRVRQNPGANQGNSAQIENIQITR